MDPYAVLAIRSQVKKSSVASGQGSEPAWNETLLCTIIDGLEELSINIMDSDVGDDDFVGELTIPLEPLFTGGIQCAQERKRKRRSKDRAQFLSRGIMRLYKSVGSMEEWKQAAEMLLSKNKRLYYLFIFAKTFSHHHL